MGLRTILFILLFVLCSIGALFAPILGILGYVGDYGIWPQGKWWHAPLSPLGIRYSYILAVLTAVGIALNWRKLRFGASFLARQEKLILIFLGAVWLSVALGERTLVQPTLVDHPAVKLTKVIIFTLMLSHVVTDLKQLNRLLWVLTIIALILGLQAYDMPQTAFVRARLELVGGADFRESNFLAAYLVAMLPLIGVQFFRSGWWGKAVCLIAGVFATNAIILTRSRGAVLGIVAAIPVAVFLAPRKYRKKILVGLIIAGFGGLYLTDPGFRTRTTTILRTEEERGASAQGRTEIWRGAVSMILSNPLGVGAGNFQQAIGQYAPEYENRDAHNTYLRCAAELGFLGIAMFIVLIVNTFLSLKRTMSLARELPETQQNQLIYIAHAFIVSLCAFLVCGITITLLYNEACWWLLV